MNNDLAARLRIACGDIRRKSYPLADLIPLLQQAADALQVSAKPTAWLVHARFPFVTMDDPIEGGVPRTPLYALEKPDAELAGHPDPAEPQQQRPVAGALEVGQHVGRGPEPSAGDPPTQRAVHVMTLRGADEYGPMLDWTKHWADFPKGTKFYAHRTPKGAEAVIVVAGPTATDVALWEAMNAAEKVGNRTDDKLIRKELNSKGLYLVRSLTPLTMTQKLRTVQEMEE